MYAINNKYVKARAIKDGLPNHPLLYAEKKKLIRVLEGLTYEPVQIDFVHGNEVECPGLSLTNNDNQRIDLMSNEEFVPSQTLIVRVTETDEEARSICLPIDNMRDIFRSSEAVDWTGEWRQREASSSRSDYTREYVEGGRGDPVANMVKLFPANSNEFFADPIVVSVLRIQRVLRLPIRED